MRNNVNGDDIKVSRGSLADHMDAYDALPPRIRCLLAGMSINWNGHNVLKVYDLHGEQTTAALLMKTEADVQNAYRERLRL
jgi:hypothetical protein